VPRTAGVPPASSFFRHANFGCPFRDSPIGASFPGQAAPIPAAPGPHSAQRLGVRQLAAAVPRVGLPARGPRKTTVTAHFHRAATACPAVASAPLLGHVGSVRTALGCPDRRIRCHGSPRTSLAGPSVMRSAVAERSGDTALPGEDSCRTPPGSSFPETKAASLPPHSKRRRRAPLPSRDGFGPLHRPNRSPPGLAKLQLGLLGSSARACSIRVSPKAKGKRGDPRGAAAPANPVLSWQAATPGRRGNLLSEDLGFSIPHG